MFDICSPFNAVTLYRVRFEWQAKRATRLGSGLDYALTDASQSDVLPEAQMCVVTEDARYRAAVAAFIASVAS